MLSSTVFNLFLSTHTFPVTKSNGQYSVFLSQAHSTVLTASSPLLPHGCRDPASDCPHFPDHSSGLFAKAASSPPLHPRPSPVISLVSAQESHSCQFSAITSTHGSKMVNYHPKSHSAPSPSPMSLIAMSEILPLHLHFLHVCAHDIRLLRTKWANIIAL